MFPCRLSRRGDGGGQPFDVRCTECSTDSGECRQPNRAGSAQSGLLGKLGLIFKGEKPFVLAFGFSANISNKEFLALDSQKRNDRRLVLENRSGMHAALGKIQFVL
jgi:hypothetical protein